MNKRQNFIILVSMKDKIEKVLNAYDFDFDDADGEYSFSVDFDTGMGVMKLIPSSDGIRFELRLDASLDILSPDYRMRVINAFNSALDKGRFTLSEVMFNPIYTCEIGEDKADEMSIAKMIDHMCDMCGMFLKLFQMILCGSSLDAALDAVGMPAKGNA